MICPSVLLGTFQKKSCAYVFFGCSSLHFCKISIAFIISSASLVVILRSQKQKSNSGHCSLFSAPASHEVRESQSLLSSEKKFVVLLQFIIFPFCPDFRPGVKLIIVFSLVHYRFLCRRSFQTRQEFVNKISLTFTCDLRRLRDIYRAIGSVESRYLNLEQT